jgi:hypothetical protein
MRTEPASRPFDTDDLPIDAERTEEERAFVAGIPFGSHLAGTPLGPQAGGRNGHKGHNGHNGHNGHDGHDGSLAGAYHPVEWSAAVEEGIAARRFSLRALADRFREPGR